MATNISNSPNLASSSTGSTANTSSAEPMPSFHEVRSYYLEFLEKSGLTQGHVATTLHITPTIISLWRHGHATDREDVTWKVWRWSHGKFNPDEPVPAPYALHGPQGVPRTTKFSNSPKNENDRKLSVATRNSRITSSVLDPAALTIPGLPSVNTVRQSMRSRAKTANGYVRANYVMDQIIRYNDKNTKENNTKTSLLNSTGALMDATTGLSNPLSLNPLQALSSTTILHPTVPLVRRSLNGQPTIDESAISALPLTGLSIRDTTGTNQNEGSTLGSSLSTTTNDASPNLPPDASYTGLLPFEEILDIRIVQGNHNSSSSNVKPRILTNYPNGFSSPSSTKPIHVSPSSSSSSLTDPGSLSVSSYECLVRWTADMSMEEVAMQNSIELTMSKVMNQNSQSSASTGSSTSTSPTAASPLSPTSTQQLFEKLQNIGLAMWVPLEHIFGPMVLRRYYSNQNTSNKVGPTVTVPSIIDEIINKQDSFSFGDETDDEPDHPVQPVSIMARGGRGRGRGRGRGSRGGKFIHPWIRIYMQQPLTPLIAAMCTLLPELTNDTMGTSIVHGNEPTNVVSFSRKRRARDNDGEESMSITAFPVPTETAFDWNDAFKKLSTTLKGIERLNEIQAKETELYRTANSTMAGASMSVQASPFSSPMTVGRSMEAKDVTARMQLPLHWDIVETPPYLTTEERYKQQESKLPTVDILQAYRPGKKRRGRGGFGATKFRGTSRGRGRGRGGFLHSTTLPPSNVAASSTVLGFDSLDLPETTNTSSLGTNFMMPNHGSADPSTALSTSSNPVAIQFAGWPDMPRGLIANLEKTLVANERIEQQYTKLLSSEDNSLLRIGGNINSTNNSVLDEDTTNHGNPKLLSAAQWLLRDYGHVLPTRKVTSKMVLPGSAVSSSSSSTIPSFTSGMSVVGPYSVISDKGTPESIASTLARYDPVHQEFPSQLPNAHTNIPGWNDYRITKFINLENVPDYCVGLEAPSVESYEPLEGTQEPVFSILVRGAEDVIAVPCTRLTPEEHRLRTEQRILLRKHLDFLRDKGGYRKVLVSDNTAGTTATSSNLPSSSASTQEGPEEDLYIADEENENMDEELETVTGTEEKKTEATDTVITAAATTVSKFSSSTASIASLTASSLALYSDTGRGGRGRGRGKRGGGGLHGRGGYRRYPPITGPIYAWIRDRNYMLDEDTTNPSLDASPPAPVSVIGRGGVRGGRGRGGSWGRGGMSHSSGVSLKSISVMEYLRKTGFANVLAKVTSKEGESMDNLTVVNSQSIDLSSTASLPSDSINIAILPIPELGLHPRDIDWSTELDVDFDELISGAKRGRAAVDISVLRKDGEEPDIENDEEDEVEDDGEDGDDDDDDVGGDTSRLPYSASRTKVGQREIGSLASTFGRVVRLPVLNKFQRPGKIVIMKHGEPIDGQPLPYQFYVDNSDDEYLRQVINNE